jgi:hypothetical protein
MPFSIWDLGGCNCPAPPTPTCDTLPVALPQTDLTGTVNGVEFPLQYGIEGECTWDSTCLAGKAPSGASALLEILQCSGGLSVRYFEGTIPPGAGNCTPGEGSANIGFASAGCAGLNTGLAITSFSASPLNITLSDGTNTIVITL